MKIIFKNLLLVSLILFINKGVNLMAVEHLSLITTPIMLYQNEIFKSQGTGFYFSKGEDKNIIIFLVTNNHVLTGYAPNDPRPAIGNNIVFYYHRDSNNPSDVKEIRYPLYNKKSKKIWLNSNTFPDADVAIIPLVPTIFETVTINCISKNWADKKMKLRPTSQVTLLGYPFGYYDDYNKLPVWKSGNIASEPELNFQGNPLILIDVSAFPGMSGSPVFCFADGTFEMNQGGYALGGKAQQFIGIYASEQILKEKKYLEQINNFNSKEGIILDKALNLGHIWKAELIIDIINNFDAKKYEEEILRDL